jgi:hypothetical protein
MANDKPVKLNADGTPKKKRESVTKKSEWTKNGKVSTRIVDSVYGPEKKPIRYTEYKLTGVSDPTEALTALKLKSAKAVSCIVRGFNLHNRMQAAGDSSLVQRVAERKGISIEEARKLLE